MNLRRSLLVRFGVMGPSLLHGVASEGQVLTTKYGAINVDEPVIAEALFTTESPPTTSGLVEGFSFVGQGWCYGASGVWYSNVASFYLPPETSDTDCINWCAQVPHPNLVGVEVYRDSQKVRCYCDFSGGRVPADVDISDYTPAAETSYVHLGTGPVMRTDGLSEGMCYRNDVSTQNNC